MDFREALAARRMVRSFSSQQLPPGVAERMLDDALRAPTAGHSCGTAWVLLMGADETGRYWSSTTTPEWRKRSARWEGLSRAPVVALSYTNPSTYVERYGEEDKRRSGLGPAGDGGGGEAAWAVPYWYGDAAFSVMTLLLAATVEGLGASFLGNFRGEERLAATLGVPTSWRLFGAVALGYPDGGDRRSASLERRRPERASRIHRGRWAHPEPEPGLAP